MTTTTSPIHVTPQFASPVCLACTKADRVTVFTTDPISHVQEMHPESASATTAQFAPRYEKIRRTAV